jgi:IS5 family transposase
MRSAQGKDEAHAVVKRITGELAGLAERAANDAERPMSNARRALRRAPAKADALAAAGGRVVNDLTGH